MPDLRPGDRGIGVSVAVGTNFETGIYLSIRELVGGLEAWDVGGCSGVRLEAGQSVTVIRVRRELLGGTAIDPYLTEFECCGRLYTCPLFHFQARTRIVAVEPAADATGSEPLAAIAK